MRGHPSIRRVAFGLLAVLWFAAACERPPAPAPSPSSPPAKASELYAADNRTLIARFDTANPADSCHGDTYCAYLVDWWGHRQTLGPLRTAGYRIVGSLDESLQARARKSTDFTLATVQPGTGLIKVMAGSGAARGGATFMMFTLVAALEHGLPLSHTIDTGRVYESGYRVDPSGEFACDGNHWCPRNTDDPAALSGPRTMWDGFGHAVVTYAVPLQERLGADVVVDVARRLGIQFRQPSDAMLAEPATSRQWGGFTLGFSETTALDLANAYATLAADGTYCDPLPVAKLLDRDGNPVAGAGPRCRSVVKPEIARAAMDAGRCGAGDASAFPGRCGSAGVLARRVHTIVDRPVAGQLGLDGDWGVALVVAGPQLATAGTGGRDTKRGPLIEAAAGIQRDGLAPLPVQNFTAPPRELAFGRT